MACNSLTLDLTNTETNLICNAPQIQVEEYHIYWIWQIFYAVTESSDDSYVSAGEDPLEAPVFEFPLQDTVASTGTEVLLKCIITGTPLPEGKSFISAVITSNSTFSILPIWLETVIHEHHRDGILV